MAPAAQMHLDRHRRRREVLDVPEPRAHDKSLDRLSAVRRQRLDRYERERSAARTAWRDARARLRQANELWRERRDAATAFWTQARQAYFTMAITSGQFRKDKAVYERMKKQTSEQRAACLEQVALCKQAKRAFFTARDLALQSQRAREKLDILRDEIRRLHLAQET